MKPVSADEIKMAEKILLPEGEAFGEDGSERVKVIQEMDKSCDVVACPGSGKTTVLLAKLLILANRMPFEDNRGICVLTHTNVAIDEIKKKAGIAGDKLFNYPNFFGTFQKFVDKFLAIPAYIKKYSKRPDFIDIDRYNNKATNYYYKLINNNLRYGLEQKFENKTFNFINNLYFDETNNDYLLNKINDKRIPYKNNNTETYKALLNLKWQLYEDGCLSFQDAYYFANIYLSIYSCQLENSFSNRFKYLFVDEMQDTDYHQLKIIEDVFEDTNTIIQYFGDPNQSIYDFSVKKENVWQPGKDGRKILKISDSKRFGNEISCVLDKLKIDENIYLKSGSSNKTFKPHLLVFKSGEEWKVLEKFVEIIHVNQDKCTEDLKYKKPVYKAIGWVGKKRTKEEINEGKLNIISYFPGFEKKSVKNKQVYENLKFYLRKNNGAAKEKGAKIYYDSIINALLEILDRGGVKRQVVVHRQIDGEIQQIMQERSYTKSSFFEELEKKGKLKALLNRIAYWSRNIYICQEDYNNSVIAGMRRYIKKILLKNFENIIENKVNEFINEPPKESRRDNTEDTENKGYIFISQNREYKNIPIEVGTVHSVKGETHTATLYMETSYRSNKNILGHESERISDFILNKKCCIQENRTFHKETLKMVHVGFSRPTHVLCFAVNENRLNKEELNSNEWNIIDV